MLTRGFPCSDSAGSDIKYVHIDEYVHETSAATKIHNYSITGIRCDK